MANNEIGQLVDLYQHIGWKHLDKWLNTQVQTCIATILNPSTPIEDVEKLRMMAATYQSLLDKVVADTQNFNEMNSHKG